MYFDKLATGLTTTFTVSTVITAYRKEREKLALLNEGRIRANRVIAIDSDGVLH